MDDLIQKLKRAVEADPDNAFLCAKYESLKKRVALTSEEKKDIEAILAKRKKEIMESFGGLLQRSYQGASELFHNEEYGSYVQIPFSTFMDGCVNTHSFFSELYNEGLDVSFITAVENPDRVLVFFNTAPYGFNDFERINNCARKHNPFLTPGEILQTDENQDTEPESTITVREIKENSNE